MLESLEQLGRDCSRSQLARHLCRELDWRGPSGRYQAMKARKLLVKLGREGRLRLPPARPGPQAQRAGGLVVGTATTPITCSLGDLGTLEVLLIPKGGGRLSKQWKGFVEEHHYLGAGPLCGDQLRYLVRCERGLLGALSFSAAARQLRARDLWIGWAPAVRTENLHRVVNNSRFLIPHHVVVPNLASHLLSCILKRLPEDWQSRYGYSPWLVESFVDRERFGGISYRAANWQAIGLSSGRGRQDRQHQTSGSVKSIWVYPLVKDFRQRLCQAPHTPRLVPVHRASVPVLPAPPADWAEEEFAGAELQDARLQQRLCTLARDLYARPQASLPQACGSRSKTKAAYRLLAHPRASMQTLLEPHYQATAKRVAAEKIVLAVQDTTSLNYSTHPATALLGPIGTEAQKIIGLLVHGTLAFTETGAPLGLLDVQCWTRDPDEKGKRHRRYELPFEAKESVRWLRSLEALVKVQASCPGTRLVSVGDREADIHELFAWAQAEKGRPALLVRAERDRVLDQGQERYWDHMRALAPAGTLELKVPRRSSVPARQATLQIRFGEVRLRAPRTKKGLPPVTLWAVLASETAPPAGVEPVEWMLLSTLEVSTFESALEKLRWYTQRWGIEVFHRVLKSGCQIETRQLAGADRLESCLAIDLVVAWRIYHLTKLGRETPDVPCTVYFQDHEWKALVAYATKNPVPPPQPPSLRDAVRLVASLGGFLGRKSDGEPGTQTVWLGLQRLDDLTAMYSVLIHFATGHPTVSSNRTYG